MMTVFTSDKVDMRSHQTCWTVNCQCFFLLIFFAALLGCVTGASVNVALSTVSCLHYDAQKCTGNDTNCHSIRSCNDEFEYDQSMESEPHKCFVLWQNVSDGAEVIMKGCWQSNDCVEDTRCVSHEANTDESYFCCCSGNLCNEDFHYDPQPKPISTVDPSE